LKVREATYKKIMVIKGTLEQTNQKPVTIADTIDATFLLQCEALAKRHGRGLPAELYLEGLKISFEK